MASFFMLRRNILETEKVKINISLRFYIPTYFNIYIYNDTTKGVADVSHLTLLQHLRKACIIEYQYQLEFSIICLMTFVFYIT